MYQHDELMQSCHVTLDKTTMKIRLKRRRDDASPSPPPIQTLDESSFKHTLDAVDMKPFLPPTHKSDYQSLKVQTMYNPRCTTPDIWRSSPSDILSPRHGMSRATRMTRSMSASENLQGCWIQYLHAISPSELFDSLNVNESKLIQWIVNSNQPAFIAASEHGMLDFISSSKTFWFKLIDALDTRMDSHQQSMIRFLVERYSFDWNVTNRHNMTPLVFACAFQHWWIASLLVPLTSHIHVRCNLRHFTALNYAICTWNPYIPLLERLLIRQFPIDPIIWDHMIQYRATYQRIELAIPLVHMLLRYGACAKDLKRTLHSHRIDEYLLDALKLDTYDKKSKSKRPILQSRTPSPSPSPFQFKLVPS